MGFGDWLKHTASAVAHPFEQAASAVSHVFHGATKMAMTGVEQLSHADHWAYSNLVARPLSTIQQVTDQPIVNAFGKQGGMANWLAVLNPVSLIERTGMGLIRGKSIGQIAKEENPLTSTEHAFNAVTQMDNWSKGWKRSSYISPGQAAWLAGAGGPQQAHIDLNDPRSVNDYFGKGTQKWFSGATDFAVNWELDPLAVAGKAVKVIRGAQTLEELLKVNKSAMLAEHGGAVMTPEIHAAAEAKTFQQASEKGGLFDKMIKATDGKSTNQILQYNFARQSTNGPLLAHLLSTAGSAEEKANIFKLSLGDAEAYKAVEASNKEIASQVNYASERWSALSNQADRLTEGSPAWMIAKSRMEDYQQQLGELDQKYGIIKSKLEAYNTLDTVHYGLGSRFAAHARAIRHDTIQPSIYDRPLMIARSLSRKSPQGYIDLNDPKSIAEVEAQLEHAGKTRAFRGQTGAINPAARDKMLSDYANATSKEERARVVAGIEKHTADKIAGHYGFTPEEATKIYAGWAGKRQSMLDESNRFSAARYTDESGQSIPVDHFMDDGGAMIIAPPLRSQMQRSHIFLDMDQYDQALRLHGGAIKTVMRSGVKGVKLGDAMARSFQSYWKMGVFLRAGFIVRNTGDDLFGQVARFGLPSMLGRMKDGGMNLVRGNVMRSSRLMHSNLQDIAQAHIDDVQESLDLINHDVERMVKLGGGNPDRVLSDKIHGAMTQRGLAQQALVEAKQKAGQIPVRQGEAGFHYGDMYIPGAFEGESGALAKKLVSADSNQYAMLGISSEKTHELIRSGHWEVMAPGVDEGRHLDGWLHVGKYQFGNDALARQVVAGKSRGEVQKWLLQTPEGRAYYKGLNLKHVRSGDLYDRVRAEVDQYFPPEYPQLRDAILKEKLTKDMLKDAMPKQYRPDIHTARTDFNMGKGFLAQKADKYMAGFYKWFATIPQDIASRNPLYAQQYEAHAKRLLQQFADRNGTHILPDDLNMVTKKAHAFAKRDTLRFTADMAHKSNAAQALSTISPFFNATQEAFTRWSRVIMDEPKSLGRMVQFFGGPAQMGLVVDSNGNKVDAMGYAIDPVTGKKYLVPQAQRTIMLGQHVVPWLKKGQKIAINQDSLNFMFQGDPVGNPGVGPLVQVAANEFAKDKPGVADFLQHAGILPYGTNNRGIIDQMLPSSIRAAKDYLAGEQSNSDWQNAYFGVLQSEYAKHGLGWRPKPADLAEIKARTKNIFGIKLLASLGLPFTAKGVPGNQYLVNEYRRLQAEDYKTADDKFYAKYGDAAFAYTAHLSKENASVPPTKAGYAAFKKYQKFIARDPDLAALYIGQDGKGNFNTNAYQAEMGTAIGGAESATIRARQSPADAMKDAQRREGWVIYNKYMKQLRSTLVDQGYTDFKDSPDLNDTKKALTDALSDPSSPYYNAEWTKDYFTFDTKKYDRIIPAMEEYSIAPEFAHRGDQKPLQQYLAARRAVTAELASRPSKSLTAQSNSDLANAWNSLVGGLIEKSLSFETLHNRFLHKDLGYEITSTGGGG